MDVKWIRTAAVAMLGMAATGMGGAAFADVLYNDDIIVKGSICVGVDCNSGESFSFDTIRMKENNLRIRFIDTSVTSGFPTRDWQILVNDSINGGKNLFAIENVDNDRRPFVIADNAQQHALYIGPNAAVGLGTSAPAVELHILEGNSPTVRLDQDGSSGFAAQAWDVGGNETNFFIRDVSNNSNLPLRIRAGAPTASIYVAADGDVGFRTTSPDGMFDIASASNANQHAFFVSATDDVGIGTGSPRGPFEVGNTSRVETDAPPFIVASNNNVGVGTSAPRGPFEVGAASGLATDPSRFMVAANGNVGTGTATPTAPMHVYRDNGTADILIEDAGTSNGFMTMLELKNHTASGTGFRITSGTDEIDLSNTGGEFRIQIRDGDPFELSLDRDGNLTVDGTVTASGGAATLPDYVFEEGYDLRSLDELRAYIEAEGHLPGVVSASEARREDGRYSIEMISFQFALLEKIEELTLYTLAQEDAIRALQAELETSQGG